MIAKLLQTKHTHTQNILDSATAKREHYLEVKKKKSNITTACLSEQIQVRVNDIKSRKN